MKFRPTAPLTRASAVAAVLALTSVGLAACGSSLEETQGGTDTAASADASLTELLPQSYQDSKTINIATAVYAPAVMEPSGGQVTGWDIEIVRQASALLGLKVNFTVIPFDGIIPGLQAGRYDAATGEINVTDERTAVVTFVTNHVSRDEMMVRADSDESEFPDAASVCGLTIGAALGSSEAATAEKMAADCQASGGAPTKAETFQTQAQVNLALSQGRIDANLASGSQAAYTVEQTKGQFKIAELGFGPEIFTGIAFPNNEDTAALTEAYQAATDQLIEDGSLQEILDDQNGGLGAVEKSEIVPAPAG